MKIDNGNKYRAAFSKGPSIKLIRLPHLLRLFHIKKAFMRLQSTGIINTNIKTRHFSEKIKIQKRLKPCNRVDKNQNYQLCSSKCCKLSFYQHIEANGAHFRKKAGWCFGQFRGNFLLGNSPFPYLKVPIDETSINRRDKWGQMFNNCHTETTVLKRSRSLENPASKGLLC